MRLPTSGRRFASVRFDPPSALRVALPGRPKLTRLSAAIERRPRVGGSGWAMFVGSAYRPFARVALFQAVVLAFATDALFIPYLLLIGGNPALVSVVGMLPVVGSLIQAALPAVLRRMRGNLGRLTLALTLIGETRGLFLALVAGLHAAGRIDQTATFVGVAAVVAVGGTAAMLAESTLAGWVNAALPEHERRVVLPRMLSVGMGLSATLLVPAGLLLDRLAGPAALWAFAGLFGVAGLASLPLFASIYRLRRPGRVQVRKDAGALLETPDFSRFLRASIWNSVAVGFSPYISVFGMVVMGISAGYAVFLAGLWSAAALIGSVFAGSFLTIGSTAWALRVAYLLRAGGMALLLGCLARLSFAPELLAIAVITNAFGFTITVVAQNERLFRLTSGPSAIAGQCRFVARNAAAYSAGGAGLTVVTAAAVEIGPPAWTFLLIASVVPRLLAARLTDLPPSWRSVVTKAETPRASV